QPDVAPDRVPLGGHVVTGHLGGPRAGTGQRAQNLDGGGLAGAVGAEETERLPGGHLEVDAADGLDLAVVLGQAGDRDRHRRPLPTCVTWTAAIATCPISARSSIASSPTLRATTSQGALTSSGCAVT